MIACPRAQLDPTSVELSLKSDGKHAFSYKLKKPYCDANGRLFDDLYTIHEEYRGEGWGIPTPESVDWIHDLARTEGIFVEKVYTSKTLYGMLDLIQKGSIDGSACYLHSGGFGALFSQFETL